MPTAYGRAEALALAESVPPEVVRDSVIHGTPDEVAKAVSTFVARGARHVQLTNMTPLAAPELAASSEALLADTVVALRAEAPAGA